MTIADRDRKLATAVSVTNFHIAETTSLISATIFEKKMTEITLVSQLILKRKKTFLCLLFIIGLVSWLVPPIDSIFPEDYSTLIFDTNGHLLRATLASDQQYRFPSDNAVLSEKYVTALLTYEDKRFFFHPGIDPMALVHATFTILKVTVSMISFSCILFKRAFLF